MNMNVLVIVFFFKIPHKNIIVQSAYMYLDEWDPLNPEIPTWTLSILSEKIQETAFWNAVNSGYLDLAYLE